MRLSSVCCLALAVVVSGAAGLSACGGGSSLDEYEDGLPSVVPAPIRAGDIDDDEVDGGRADAGRADGGTANSGSGKIGEGCTKSEQCGGTGSSCTTSVSVGVTLTFPNGYCTQACNSSTPCPSGSACLTFANTCLRPCTSNSECRTSEGYTCMAPLFGQKFCLPANTPTSATGGGGAGGLLGGLLGG